MAEDETAAESPEISDVIEDDEGEGAPSNAELAAKVDALADKLDRMFHVEHPAKGDEATDVAAQVRDEVAKLQAAEKKDRAARSKITQLENQVKKLGERAPVEYRKITTAIWGPPE